MGYNPNIAYYSQLWYNGLTGGDMYVTAVCVIFLLTIVWLGSRTDI